MNDVNRFLEEGILQAIRNLLPVKSILRDSLQEDEDDGIQLESIKDPKAETPVEPQATALSEEVVDEASKPISEPLKAAPEPRKQDTLFVDTEKSVGFTGIDSVFGTSGEAELRPSTEASEETEELKILGDLEELDIGEIEDLDAPQATPTPLSADDYESL